MKGISLAKDKEMFPSLDRHEPVAIFKAINMFNIIVLCVFSAVAVHAQSDSYCEFIRLRSCANDAKDEVCATNGITYRNRCEFAKVYCQNKDIHLNNQGTCSTTAAQTTMKMTSAPIVGSTPKLTTQAPLVTMTTMKPINGSVIVLDIFCLDLNYITCQSGGVAICGSDGITYANACEFDKERCFHRDLEPSNSGCP